MPKGNYSFTSSAAEFIHGLYDDWGQDRTSMEIEWQNALDAFMANANAARWKKTETEDWRSDYFSMLIKTKTIGAYSVICDTILQGGKIPFDLLAEENEPKPEDMVKEIRQQFGDGKADREFMKALLSMPLYGKGIIKCPLVKTYEKASYRRINNAPQYMMGNTAQYTRYEPHIYSVKIPAIEYVSVWDLFSDHETDNLQEGFGVIQRTLLSAFDLRQKINAPFFNQQAIKRIVSESDGITFSENVQSLSPALRQVTNRIKNILYLEFWGRFPVKLLDEYKKKHGSDSLAEFDFNDSEIKGEEIEVNGCIANGELVRLVENPLGHRPFFQALWEPVLDTAEGRGVATNLVHDQKMKNGIMRAIIDNMRLAGNVMLAGKLEAWADGELPKFKPGFYGELAADVDDVRQAIQQILVSDVSSGLLALDAVIDRNADENTNLPKMITGETVQQKKQETAFEIDQRMQNAGKYLGSVIRNIDEGLIEPMVSAFYRYNMDRPGNENVKGNFTVAATGFSSFQNRFLRTQSMKQLLTLVLSHEALLSEVNVKPHLEEIYKGHDLDPQQLFKTEQQKQQEQQQAQQQRERDIQIMMEERAKQLEKMIAETQEIMAEAKLKTEKAKTEEVKRQGEKIGQFKKITEKQRGAVNA